MNINATLIGQSVAFIIFIWFCMKFVWPPVMRALEERKKKIADGLAFSEQADKKLAQAKEEADKHILTAQEHAREIVNKASQRAMMIVDEAKVQAKEEAKRIRLSAQSEIEQEVMQAREVLRKRVASLAVTGATHIVGEYMDEAANSKLVEKLAAEL